MSKYLIALVAAASSAGVASQVAAQNGDARDAAMALCITQAHTQYPDDGITSQGYRTAVYKACMAAGGFKP